MAKKDTAVLNPSLGVYLDRGALSVPKRAMVDCLDVRVRDGRVMRDNMGWGPFPDASNHIQLGRPVLGIDNFFLRGGGQWLLFMTDKDIFRYEENNHVVSFLTPRYATGTVDVTNGSAVVSGTSTSWNSELKAGDYFHAGDNAQTDPEATWYEIDSVDNDTQITLTTNYQEATDTGLDYTVRKTFTGDTTNIWTAETFPSATAVSGSDGDRWYASNGIDNIVAWDGVADQVYVPSLGNLDTAKYLLRYKNMMLFINITTSGDNKPFSIRNSAIGEPENVTTKEASELVVHDGVDPLISGHVLGDNAVFYADRSITLGQFIGGDIQFIFRNVIRGIGALSSRAIADFGDYHEFHGPDAYYRFDGISITEQGQQVFREVLRKQHPNRLDMLHGHFDEENGELIWFLPLTGDTGDNPEFAYAQHYLELVGENDPTPITIRKIPATATGYFSRETTLTFNQLVDQWKELNFRWSDRFFEAAFPFNLFGDINGNIFILGNQDSKNGASILSYARFSRRPLGDIRRKGTVVRVYPFAEQLPLSAGLQVLLHLANDPAGKTTQAGPFTYDMTQSTSNHFVSPRKTARYVEVEFRTEGVGEPFFLQGYDMDVVPAGAR